MKKYIILGVVAGCMALLIAGWWAVDKANLFALKGMIMTELVGDVAKFYGDNKRLPLGWDEFASWAEKTHTDRNWAADVPELKERFALKWGAQVSSNDPQPQKLFIVLAPEFKDIEPGANDKLYAWCKADSK